MKNGSEERRKKPLDKLTLMGALVDHHRPRTTRWAWALLVVVLLALLWILY